MYKIKKILEKSIDKKLVDKLINSYLDIIGAFKLRHWKPSELDAGHFVEVVRRILEFEFTGSYTPIGKSLEGFTDKVLAKYENYTAADDSYRFHIPRVCKAIVNIRNKRGVGHVSEKIPNIIDSTFIVNSCKWILSELVVINSGLTDDETFRLVETIIRPSHYTTWEVGDKKRILVKGLSAREKIILLLANYEKMPINELRDSIEYSHSTNFRKIVQSLHADRQIEFDGVNCNISPLGHEEAERILAEKLEV